MLDSTTTQKLRQSPMRFFQLAEKVLNVMGVSCIGALMLLICADVLMRYAFNSPIVGAYEIGTALLVSVIFLCAAYTQAERGHIRVELYFRKFSVERQAILLVFAWFVCLAVVSMMAWRGSMAAWQAWETGDYAKGLLRFPHWPSRTLVAVGSTALALRFLLDLLTDLARLVKFKAKSNS